MRARQLAAASTHTPRRLPTYATWHLGRALLGHAPGLVHLAPLVSVGAKGPEPHSQSREHEKPDARSRKSVTFTTGPLFTIANRDGTSLLYLARRYRIKGPGKHAVAR
jgi:hypothetical protein